jgi:hypothetical protein
MNGNDGRGRDRGYDTITFILAGVLAAIVLGAIGYGIVNSSRVTTAIPAMSPGQPAKPASQVSTTTGGK